MAIKVVTTQNLAYYHQKATEATDAKLALKVDKVEGKQLSTEDFTTEMLTKLSGIATGAQVNVIESVKVNGTALGITDKAVDIDLSAYAKLADLTTVFRYKGSVATYEALPSENLTVGDVYNVESDGSNYVWNGTAWDDLGGEVDLTGYYTKSEVDSALALKANASDVYTKTEVDGQIDAVEEQIAGLTGESGSIYTKTEIDALLGDKADVGDSYTKAEADALLAAKANAADVYAKTETYTKDEVDAAIAAHVCVEAMTDAEIDAIFA